MISRPDNHAHPVVLAATDAGADVEIVGDVYRAIARIGIGENEGESYAAIVVDVERLSASEMELFDLVARFHWELPVYVFGSDRSAARVQAALQRGARAEVDPAALAKRLSNLGGARFPERAAEVAAGVDEPTRSGTQRRRETEKAVDMEPGPAVAAEPGPTRASKPRAKSAEGESAGPVVPVPWRPHPGRPQRTPPTVDGAPESANTQQRADVTSTEADSAQGDAGREAEPPLLSRDELEALTGGRITPASRRAGEEDAS